ADSFRPDPDRLLPGPDSGLSAIDPGLPVAFAGRVWPSRRRRRADHGRRRGGERATDALHLVSDARAGLFADGVSLSSSHARLSADGNDSVPVSDRSTGLPRHRRDRVPANAILSPTDAGLVPAPNPDLPDPNPLLPGADPGLSAGDPELPVAFVRWLRSGGRRRRAGHGSSSRAYAPADAFHLVPNARPGLLANGVALSGAYSELSHV